ncbi:alpha carbonic anhydrase 4-like [Durio zibethinus]|uniref:Alpha carbonic anhydrase 4-like n=1 Tax=Durio zibethinus TaxID=66656 RepID=A0A6P5YTR0_DURZI|nr:alpha carbonic anhydrase 4-like [Durio zibethinus]
MMRVIKGAMHRLVARTLALATSSFLLNPSDKEAEPCQEFEGLRVETEEGNQTMKYSNINLKTPFAFSFFLFSSLILSAYSQSESEDHEFNYDEASGRGPSRWGLLKPESKNCSIGRQQSPINIEAVQVRSELGDLQRNYVSAPAVLRNNTEYAAVVWLGNAGSITINGTVYTVDNCHWHSPAEHTLNGIRYPLEIHIVHTSDQNQTAVVAILYRYGSPDPFIDRLFGSLKTLKTKDRPLGPVNPESIKFPGRNYYRYKGSLTTPSCSEGVVWKVFQQVKTVSHSQVDALKHVLPPQNRNNARPTQPLNGRPVLLYDPPTSGN